MQITVRDVAALLNVSTKSVYRWVTEGDLPAYRIQDQYRFNRSELLEWAMLKKINVAPEIFHEPESSTQLLPTLTESIEAGGVLYRVEGKTKEAVILSLSRLLPLPDGTDREFVGKVLLAREALSPTAVGDGIAVPHPRSPVVLHATVATLTVAFLEKPIEFGAFDGKPVSVLLTLISPTERAQFHLLSRLNFALRDKNFVKVLLKHGLREEITKELKRVERDFKAVERKP